MESQILKSSDNDFRKYKISVFLAGSIEADPSEDWRIKVQNKLKNFPITIFNPKVDSKDIFFERKKSNPKFNYQVNWELDKLQEANLIFMNFLPNNKSPITLLELGLNAQSGKMIVCCPDGFYYRGNVEIVCLRYNIPFYDDFDSAVDALISSISKMI